MFVGVFCLIYIEQPEKLINPVKGTAILHLLYSVFMIAGLSYILITWCISQINTAAFLLQVVACAVFAYFLNDGIPNATQIMGCLTIYLTVEMAAWGNSLKEELDYIVKENQSK